MHSSRSEGEASVKTKTYSQLSGSLNPNKCVGQSTLNIAEASTLSFHLPVTSGLSECSMGTNSCQVCVAPVFESQLYALQPISTEHNYWPTARRIAVLLKAAVNRVAVPLWAFEELLTKLRAIQIRRST